MRQIESIEESLPALSDTEGEIRLRALLSDIGDAHTDLSLHVEL